LKRLGKVLHITRNRLILVQVSSKAVPQIGSYVFDRRNRRIGRVYDIIGPTKSPFVLIRPLNTIEKLDKELFVR